MKRVLMFLLIVVMVLSFAACGGTEQQAEDTAGDEAVNEASADDGNEGDVSVDDATVEMPEFSIEIAGADVAAFTNVDAEEMEMVEFDAIKTSKDGSEKTNHWKGIPLKDVLAFAGVEAFQSLTLEADDGYTQEYTPEIVEGDVILAIMQDGELLNNSGPIQMVVKDQPSNMWVKRLTKITIN